MLVAGSLQSTTDVRMWVMASHPLFSSGPVGLLATLQSLYLIVAAAVIWYDMNVAD